MAEPDRERTQRRKRVVALWAVCLAALGMVVSAGGARWGKPFLETKLGPALTLLGAGVWLFARLREGRSRR